MEKSNVMIIGSGGVGSTIAYSIMLKDIVKNIYLLDYYEEKAKGEVADLQQGFSNISSTKVLLGKYKDVKDCGIIIITAGRNRNVGESRLDLIHDNKKILDDIIEKIQPYYNNSVIICVSNPVDILTQHLTENLTCNKNKIIGTGCLLDTARLNTILSNYLKVELQEVHSLAIGEHGDRVIPVWNHTYIKGKSIEQYCREMNILWNAEIAEKLRRQLTEYGAYVIERKSRTQFGISTCVAEIVHYIITDQKKTLSVCSVLNGEYGISDVPLSLPCVIDGTGICKKVLFELSNEEIDALKISQQELKKYI